MKTTIIAVFIFALTSAYAGTKTVPVTILEKIESGVVYIEVSVFFDSKKIKNRQYFEKFEKEADYKILDSYFVMGFGSGFFIDEEGHILTNYHVIGEKKDKSTKNTIIKNMGDSYRRFPLKNFSGADFETFFTEFSEILLNTKTDYRVCVNNKDFYDAKILEFDEKRDICLIKIEGKKFDYLKIGGYKSLVISNPVAAIGYPRNFEIMKYVSISKASITLGNISAIRNDNFSIQHTAPTNPGNSGGPLINEEGIVIGINSRYINEAKIISLAIPVKNILGFLKDTDTLALLKYNFLETDVSDHIETGENIFIDLDPSFTVYLNGEKAGNAPVLLKTLKAGDNTVTIESDISHSEKKFIVNKDIKNNFIYVPELIPYTSNLSLKTNPDKALINIDGMEKGKSELFLKKIECGYHDIEIKLDGYSILKDKIFIRKDKTFEKTYELNKASRLYFTKKLPEDSVIKLEKQELLLTYSSGENIFLENGKWKIYIDSSLFSEPYSSELEITGKNQEMNVKPKYIFSRIFFENLKKDSSIFIDDENITPQIVDNTLNYPIGKHWVEIKTKNYDNIIFEMELNKGKDKYLKLDYSFNLFAK